MDFNTDLKTSTEKENDNLKLLLFSLCEKVESNGDSWLFGDIKGLEKWLFDYKKEQENRRQLIKDAAISKIKKYLTEEEQEILGIKDE